jgi:ADP-ribose pyrophosphatase YjhB (NUDIX family)
MTAVAVDRTAHLPRKRVSAGVLFTDRGRVLLVEPVSKPYWDLPGGVVEAGESPHAAAGREVKEELGITVAVGRLLVVDFMPPRPDLTEALMLVYSGGVLLPDTEIHVQAEEVRSWAWCTPGGQRARQLKAPILARRVAAARKAIATGTTIYLESGWEVKP